MSQEGIKALLARVESDESFRERLLAAGSEEDRQHLLVEAGYEVEPTDLPTFKEIVGFGELSDEELEWVAGGGIGTQVAIGVGSAVGGAVTGVAAVASAVAALF